MDKHDVGVPQLPQDPQHTGELVGFPAARHRCASAAPASLPLACYRSDHRRQGRHCPGPGPHGAGVQSHSAPAASAPAAQGR
eukprot:6310320-Lingulodinium_polyedra.AAC.1